MIGFLSHLISIESISTKPEKLREVVEVVKEEFRDTDLIVKEFEYNSKPSLLVSPTNQIPEIILNAHADVVPAKSEQFTIKTVGDKLYGRGTQDMKGALAVMVSLMKDLPKLPIGLMVVTDEEIGGFDGSKKLLHEAGIRPKFFLAGESTDLKIEYEAKGITWLKIRTHGKNAHGAYLWEGQNAITKLSHELIQINNLYPQPEHFVWETTCNLGKISGGQATNQVPDLAEATLDIRRIPNENTTGVVEKIKNKMKYPDTEVEIVMDEPAHHADKNNDYIKSLIEVITKHHGQTEYVQKCGASDARHYSAEGIPAICFGPVGAGLHTDDEWVSIHSLETYYEILKEWALRVSHP